MSGGRDSLALALLAHDWAAARKGRVLALIVDHGLRPESGAEARTTLERLGGIGIAGEILDWVGAKPVSGLQEAARDARYRLLFAACRRHGILHLLVAHHAGDQAETIAMRAARRSGPDGLAGMAAVVEHRDARLLRPLLGVPRDRLTATLERRGDRLDRRSVERRPALRARARSPGRQRSSRAPSRNRRPGRRAIAFWPRRRSEALDVEPDGEVALDHTLLSRMDEEIAARLLSRVVQSVGGGDYPPRRDRLERAAARLSQGAIRGKSGKSQDFTLSGCRLMLRQVPGSRRLRWIVRAESGRSKRGNGASPSSRLHFLLAAPAGAPHVD